ncbi:MAG TPA: CHRD domain-containing protein [Anaerolineae bacterium]|nr:CHRD domain-containing protein [Anaerolineae bacterium]
MKKIYVILTLVLASLLVASVAVADEPLPTTFVAALTADQEVPPCGPATQAARGLFVGNVVDEATGTVEWTLVANNLPGSTTAAHIHFPGPAGVAAPVVQPLPITPGEENGVIGTGSFSNPVLVAGIRAAPELYYVNVHTGPLGVGCPPGVIRGQLDLQGPLNN